jgi:RNA polymerase sigma-70 factor (ECF subfamily)
LRESLLGFIRRRVRSREAAEDILQEVLLRIHSHAGAVEDTTAIGAWVHRVATNAIADHHRSAPVRRELVTSEVEPVPTGGSDADGPDARGELAACVAPLLRQLPAKYREALTLTELEGLSQAEAARRAGVSLSGMKSRVQRARMQLRRVLLDCCDVELDRRRAVTDWRPRREPCDCGSG